MLRILIVEDDLDLQATLKKALELAGHDVHTANDGDQASRLMKTLPVDLVITDLLLPEKDGIGLISEIKTRHPDVPVIAISGGGIGKAEHYLRLAKLMGAHRVLTKPIKIPDLLQAIEHLSNPPRAS